MNRNSSDRLRESRKLRRQKDYRPLKIVLFFFTLFLIAVVSFIIPLRPTHSDSEKRDLAVFPKFSVKALVSGDYFDDINLWFSDTFPFRENIVAVKGALEGWQGIRDVQIHGDFGSADEIPDIPVPQRPVDEPESKPVSEPVSEPSSEPVSEPSSEPVSEPTSEASSEPEEDPGMLETQNFGGILQIGNSAYESYNFSLSVADRYAATVSKAAKELDGVATVYDIIIPTSIGIVAPSSVVKNLNVSDQRQAIEYMYGSMSGKVKTVPLYDLFLAHRKEYLYFRTDHHWTARAAYYAYSAFLQQKGKTAMPLEDYEEKPIENFLGSFYASTGKSSALSDTPDTVYTYHSGADTFMAITDKSGKCYQWPLINDTTSYPTDLKYCAFIGGDYPFTEIDNHDLNDGSSIVVIKESFGNALVPFIADSYQKVYVIDYRYWNGNLASFVKSNGVQDVLFVNNISATRGSTLVSKIEGIQD